MQLGQVLISESRIADAVQEIAGRVSKDYDLSRVVLVGAMDGAVCFLSDLMRAFGEPVDVTTVRMRRYDGTHGGEVLSQRLLELGAASIDVCALLDKPSRRTHDVKATYIGFEVPDVFVVGYGMDYDGAYRSLRDVCVLEGGDSELN